MNWCHFGVVELADSTASFVSAIRQPAVKPAVVARL
jgi:hypothetical protein